MTPHEDYQAIREGAALGAVAPRHQIAVAGRDRATYLQGLLTNDIPSLSPGGGCYSAWLTPQGRMLTDMYVLESGGMILLDVPAETTQATLERLDQFIFTEDVQVASLAESLTSVWVHGPQAPAVLARVFGRSEPPPLALRASASLAEAEGEGGRTGPTSEGPFAAWPEYHHAQFEFHEQPVRIVRIDQLGAPGFCVYLDPAREQDLVNAFLDAGARSVSPDAIETARVEAGYPVFGIDMTDDTIPLEAGIEDRAISLTKGCYVGQEVIIRVLHRGQGRVVRKLMGLRIDGAVPQRGARLFAGDKDVGFVTSAATSPRLGTIAMGYVHRDHLAAGSKVEVATDSGRVPATVIERLILSGA